VVALPSKARLKQGPELLWAVYRLEPGAFERVADAMRNDENWVLLQAGFDRERWLSDHIAVSPHELEAGMRPYPWAKVREQVFEDRTRSDVLLLDRSGNPVVVGKWRSCFGSAALARRSAASWFMADREGSTTTCVQTANESPASSSCAILPTWISRDPPDGLRVRPAYDAVFRNTGSPRLFSYVGR
jgi:hypothetical protein